MSLVVAGHGRHPGAAETAAVTVALERQLERRPCPGWRRAGLPAGSHRPLGNDRRKCLLCSLARSLAPGGAAKPPQRSDRPRRQSAGAADRAGPARLSDLAGAEPEPLAECLECNGEQHGRSAAPAWCPGPGAAAKANAGALEASRRPGRTWSGARGSALDIESDPDARDDFLHGFLRIKRQAELLADHTEGQPRTCRAGLHEHRRSPASGSGLRLLLRSPSGLAPCSITSENRIVSLCRCPAQGESEREVQALRGRMIRPHKDACAVIG